MATYAVIDGTTVVNIIIADALEIAEAVTGATCVEYTYENPAGIGYVYDAETGTFLDPNVEPSVTEN